MYSLLMNICIMCSFCQLRDCWGFPVGIYFLPHYLLCELRVAWNFHVAQSNLRPRTLSACQVPGLPAPSPGFSFVYGVCIRTHTWYNFGSLCVCCLLYFLIFQNDCVSICSLGEAEVCLYFLRLYSSWV